MVKKNRKAAIEMQFNWVFILIIGAIIIAFFFSVVQKQKQISNIKLSGAILTDLEAIVSGAKAATGTASIITIPHELELSCGEYSIGDVTERTLSKVIFGPEAIKGRQLLIWALDWNAPFRVTNFLFMTSPQVRYILIRGSLAEEINKTLPDEMNKEIIKTSEYNPSSIKDENNYKVRFVFFDSMNPAIPLSLQNMYDKDVTAVKVDGDGEKGEITFYQKNKTTNQFEENGKSYYLGMPSLIGAIFSEDLALYNCTMLKAFYALNLVNEIYADRTSALSGSLTSCASWYNAAEFEAVREDSASLSESISEGNINSLYESMKTIGQENDNALLYSCPAIY